MIKKIFCIAMTLVIATSLSVTTALAKGDRTIKCGDFRVRAGDTDYFKFNFYRGEMGAVVLKGDGDTDLDVYVYNEYGDLVGKDEDYSDGCVVSWYVYRSASYTVKVVNRGSVYNDYSICIGAKSR
jgi:hypothetical protein